MCKALAVQVFCVYQLAVCKNLLCVKTSLCKSMLCVNASHVQKLSVCVCVQACLCKRICVSSFSVQKLLCALIFVCKRLLSGSKSFVIWSCLTSDFVDAKILAQGMTCENVDFELI